jgi:hypothetical protein
MDEVRSTPGGDRLISRNQLRDALAALVKETAFTGEITFPYRYTFDMADAVMRHVDEQLKQEAEMFTYGEIRASYNRIGVVPPDRLIKDMREHRQVYKPGTIGVAADGKVYRRTTHLGWRELGHVSTENQPAGIIEVIYTP